MINNVLQDIISRCDQRHEQPLKQKKTKSLPRLYKGYPCHFTVYCAHNYPVMLDDLAAAGISIMPIGSAPGSDRPPRNFGGNRFLKRQQETDWDVIRWHKSWGIQVYTGIPSAHDDAPWHDLVFKYEAICTAPTAVLDCIQSLVSKVTNPLLTMTKSGGIRFSCRIPGYLHPKNSYARVYVSKQNSTAENVPEHEAYIEILGEQGFSRWDARYEILIGDLLNPPMISKEDFFFPINALRTVNDGPIPQSVQYKWGNLNASDSLGSYKLDLAKEALFKRGFSYVRQVDGFHYWNQQDGGTANTEVSLWEDGGTVWVRAANSDIGLPIEATPITDVWNDTGILPPLPTNGLPIDDLMTSVREEKISPLAIKRPIPILHKSRPTEKIDEAHEEDTVKEQDTADSEKNLETESHNRNSEAICLNIPESELTTEVEGFFEKRNVGTVERWRDRMYLWDQVKDITADVRMATPFQRGNVCEDPERCEAIQKRGGNPSKIICPECPVYTACQERGYLSQQSANAQIIENDRLFLDPQYAKIAEQLLDTRDGTQRLCIIDTKKGHRLFLEYKLTKTTLEEWIINWQGDALGDFAIVLLNAIETRDKFHANFIKRIRAVAETFEWLADELIQQMCHVKIRGKVVIRGVVDEESGEELARYTIEFDQGTSAYIPLDAAAAAKLAAQGLPLFQLHTFVPNEDMEILMPIADVIRLGIMDTSTVENIQKFPTVCLNSDWTLWHQLKCFFAHYKRDADAPMQWEDEKLQFRIPPKLHPNVKLLMATTPVASSEDVHLHRTLPDAKIEILPAKPTTWASKNYVYQLRTEAYPRQTIIDFNNTWESFGVSEVGQRIFWNIQTEIERDPTIKHGIIVHRQAIEQLKDIASNENVSFLTIFRETKGLETAFQEAQVIWIVGVPDVAPQIMLDRTRILFGNDNEPLSYAMEPNTSRYRDERVQSVYEITVSRIFREIIEIAQLHRLENKKIMLLTGLRIPEITDRPETHLFDWEDFYVAGGLHKLPDVIATRVQFETERDNLTTESSSKEVERILGCSTRQANRVLQRMRGGKLARVPFRDQILALLAGGEMKTPEIVEAIEGNPKAINTKLTRLVEAGEIVKVKRGVYTLPDE